MVLKTPYLPLRTGLIHVNDGNPGAAMSADLRNLPKVFAIAELEEGAHELHGVLLTSITSTHWFGEF